MCTSKRGSAVCPLSLSSASHRPRRRPPRGDGNSRAASGSERQLQSAKHSPSVCWSLPASEQELGRLIFHLGENREKIESVCRTTSAQSQSLAFYGSLSSLLLVSPTAEKLIVMPPPFLVLLLMLMLPCPSRSIKGGSSSAQVAGSHGARGMTGGSASISKESAAAQAWRESKDERQRQLKQRKQEMIESARR